MSPVPIIELQRRLTLVGAIRAGGEKPERGVGKKLEAFRLTSPRKQLIEQAAELYGGEVTPWRSPVGDEWQVYTQQQELPVLVMPGYSLRQSYELWEGATKRTRLCDGVDEELSGGPCLCDSEGVDQCDIYTRIVVALPELDTVLGWRLITKGANAAHELPTMMDFIGAHAVGATFVPARMRIDARRGVKDGQVVRYVVPVLDLGVGYLAAAQQRPALEAAGTPGRPEPVAAAEAFRAAMVRSPSTDEALEAVTGARHVGTRHPLPEPDPPDDPAPEAPHGQDDEPRADEPAPTYSETRQTKLLTKPQNDKLNVLVGTLRDEGHITTGGLYKAIGQLREQDGEALAEAINGYDQDGVLHWAPLRKVLTRPEADQLITWLVTKRQQVDEETAAAGTLT